MNSDEKKLLKTLCYSDVFDYPLTRLEVEKFQIQSTESHQVNSKFNVQQSKHVGKKGQYYFLKGRFNIVSKRKKREVYALNKLNKAKKLSQIFKIIPTVKMITVTGTVAAGNAKVNDDIDIMIVTASSWLWTTRFFSVLIAELFGVRRRPNDKKSNNKLCLNMFVNEDHLPIPKNERDIFSANEVVRMKVLWSREDMAKRFYFENKWIISFLPNVKIQSSKVKNKNQKLKSDTVIERFAKYIQFMYMQSRRTNEVIRDGYIRFHPNDARRWILKEYCKRLQRFGIE